MQTAMREAVPCVAANAATLGEVMAALVEDKMRMDIPLMRQLLVHYSKLVPVPERLHPRSVPLAVALHALGAIHYYSFGNDAAACSAFQQALTMQKNCSEMTTSLWPKRCDDLAWLVEAWATQPRKRTTASKL